MVRIAVIGAGPSGLTAIKACKESNLDVVCYEWSDSIGGIWNYKEMPVEGMGSVDKTTITNTSKEFLAYSDFPFPKEYPNFMRHTYVLKYLKSYAENFRLLESIKFKHKVVKVEPVKDYETTGRWKIIARDEIQMLEVEDEMDALMVCTGHQGYPLKARFPDDEKFRGSIIHNHSYKDSRRYEGKTVLIVGLGNTGGDIAVDLCSLAEKTYLSTRKGAWIIKRMGKYGVPYDLSFLNRISYAIGGLISFDRLCSNIESDITEWFDPQKYQLKPKHRALQQLLTVNDVLPSKILAGEVIVKGNVLRFEDNGVVFEGEVEVTKVDCVILATGYEIKFPFLSDDVLRIENNQVELYKFVFPPHLKHPTLGIIGLLDGVSGVFPYLEMQARWFVEILKGRVSLPSEVEMRKDISETIKYLKWRFYPSPRHNIIADYVGYLNDISSRIGVKPNLWKILIRDPKLWLALVKGPFSPYQYRLSGVNSWPLARETILNYESRIWFPLQTRFKENEDKTSKERSWKVLAFVVLVLGILLACFAL